jgi:Na+-exporting ATPase
MATIHRNRAEDKWEASGDPTEVSTWRNPLDQGGYKLKKRHEQVALQVFVHKLGHGKPHLSNPHPPKLTLAKSRSRSTERGPTDNLNAPSATTGEGALSPGGGSSTLERTVSATSAHSDQNGPSQLAKRGGHFEMVVEHPFDSTIKRMSTVWRFVPAAGSEQSAYAFVFMKFVFHPSHVPISTEEMTNISSANKKEGQWNVSLSVVRQSGWGFQKKEGPSR